MAEPPLTQYTVSDILGDLDDTPPDSPAAAGPSSATSRPRATGSDGGGGLVLEDSLPPIAQSKTTPGATKTATFHRTREDFGTDPQATTGSRVVRAQGEGDESFLDDVLGSAPEAPSADQADVARAMRDSTVAFADDVTLGRPQRPSPPPEASPAPRPPGGVPMTDATPQATTGSTRHADAAGLHMQESVQSVSRALSMGSTVRHHRTASLGGTFRERLSASMSRKQTGAVPASPASESAAAAAAATSGMGASSPSDFGSAQMSMGAFSEVSDNTMRRTFQQVAGGHLHSPSFWRHTDEPYSGALPRLMFIEQTQRQRLELQHANELATLAMRASMEATKALAAVHTHVSDILAARAVEPIHPADAAALRGWIDERLDAIDAAAEEKVAMLASFMASSQQAAASSSSPAPAAAASSSRTPTSAHPELPPLNTAAVERQQQRLLVGRPQHQRTGSGQLSDCGSFASGAGGSFALDAAAAAAASAANAQPATQQQQQQPPLAGSAGGGGLTPRSTRARSSSMVPPTGRARSTSVLFSSPRGDSVPGGTGATLQSPNVAAPPKSHERPEAHRKVLNCGRIAGDPHVTTPPPVRVDQVTSEAQRWGSQDFGDYTAFTALGVFLYGPPGSGKSTLAQCLVRKPPTFFKSTPKVDPKSISIQTTLHRLQNVKVPGASVALGGCDDQRVDVRALMRAAANAGNAGVATLQSSACLKIHDIPWDILERWAGPASLPVRGTLHCLCFDLSADRAAARRQLGRAVRHILSVSCGTAFPMPTVVVEGDATNTAAASSEAGTGPLAEPPSASASGADFGRSSTAHANLKPLRVNFVLLGTNRDKLTRDKADDVAVQAALREEREWLLRLFKKLTDTRAVGGEGPDALSSSGSPTVEAYLADAYAVSCEKWTVIGERARSATSFPELIESLYTSALLNSPTAPQHIASTIVRHCAGVLLRENEGDAADAAALDATSPITASFANVPKDDTAADDDDPSGGLIGAITDAVKSEIVRAMVVPMQPSSKAGHGSVPQSPTSSDSGHLVMTGNAALVIEQDFAKLSKAFIAERQLLAKQQREAAAAAGEPVVTVTPPKDAGTDAGGSDLTKESTTVKQEAASLLAASASVVHPASRGSIDFSSDALPTAYREAARYMFVAFSFGLSTLFTSLQRWIDFAGCVLDGVIFQGLVVQHLHVKSVAAKLIRVALAAAKEEGFDASEALDDAAIATIEQRLTSELCRRVVASVLSVGRARGILSLVETVPSAGCNAVLLGLRLPHYVLSFMHVPRALFRRVGVHKLVDLHHHQSAVNAFFEQLEREGVVVHDDFGRTLMRAAAELADHAELEARLGAGVASSRPPSAAAINFRLVVELMMNGYVNVKLLDAIVRPPLDALLLPEAFTILLGAREISLSRDVDGQFIDSHRVRLQLSGNVICTSGRDFLVPALAAPLPPAIANFIAFTMATAAESGESVLTGSINVSGTPMSFIPRLAVAMASACAPFLHFFRAWSNAFVVELSTVPLLDSNGNRVDRTGSSSAGDANYLPEGAILFQILVAHEEGDVAETKCKVCVTCIDKRPVPSEHPLDFDDHLCRGEVYDVETCLDGVLIPLVESEASAFGRSLSQLCPDDASHLCSVKSSASLGGPTLPWDGVVAKCRELLVTVPRSAADASLDALRRVRDGAAGAPSIRPVLEPALAYSLEVAASTA